MIYIRRDNLRLVFVLAVSITCIVVVLRHLITNTELKFTHVAEKSVKEAPKLVITPKDADKPPTVARDNGPKGKCGLPAPCPLEHFAFRVASGATNMIGPEICLEGQTFLEKNSKGKYLGISISVANGKTGEHIKTDSFKMWDGNVQELIDFLKSIPDGSLVLMATSDDPATKLNDEARSLIAALGSSFISKLSFRDNWVFVGGKETKTQVSYEQLLKNEGATNKYINWPEMIEMGGCVPKAS